MHGAGSENWSTGLRKVYREHIWILYKDIETGSNLATHLTNHLYKIVEPT